MTQVKIDYNGITHISCRALAYTLLGTTNQELLSNSISRKIEHNIRNSKPWYLGVEKYDKNFKYHIQELERPIDFLDRKFDSRSTFLKFINKEYKRPYRYINSIIDMYMVKGLSLEDALDHMMCKLLCSVGAEHDYSSKCNSNKKHISPPINNTYTQ